MTKKDSSESSIDDDGFLDEQEDPMTGSQISQQNTNSTSQASGGTLCMKQTANNATRAVKNRFFLKKKHFVNQIS